ncbi:MAG: Sec-independent protein translocase protein TatA [Thermoleophilia bacterium]|nr:Sec-independent protein translocase protein TatA [Thermoleophilia bacterium]
MCLASAHTRATVPAMGIHWQELIIILLIVLVLFGPKRLPEIGSSLGKSIHGFRSSLSGLDTHQPANADQVPVVAASATETAPPVVPAPVEVVTAPDTASTSDSSAH